VRRLCLNEWLLMTITSSSEWHASTDPSAMLDTLRTWTRFPSSPDMEALAHPVLTDRKLRLFAAACCRQVWDRLTDDAPCGKCTGGYIDITGFGQERIVRCPDCGGTGRVNRSRRAVEVAERWCDGEVTGDAFLRAREDCNGCPPFNYVWNALAPVASAGASNAVANARLEAYTSGVIHVALLREIFGDPFAPLPRDPHHHIADERVCEKCFSRFSRHPGHCTKCASEFIRKWRVADEVGLWRTPTVLAIATRVYDERCWEDLPILADALHDAGCEDEDVLGHLRRPAVCRLCKGKRFIDRPVICGPDTSEAEMRRLADEAGGPIPCPSCRRDGAGPHVRGCWVLDLLLGKS